MEIKNAERLDESSPRSHLSSELARLACYP